MFPHRLGTALLLLIANSMVVEIQAEEECCSRKMVGSVSYTLLPPTSHTLLPGPSPPELPHHQCLNHCVYTVSGTSTPKFCFGTGDLPTECLSGEPEVPGNVPEVRCGVRRESAACLERNRIVGGNEAGCNEWPWQVGLLSRDAWGVDSAPFCGGALVNSRHIVTAAHCTHDETVADIAVLIGDHNVLETEPEQTWVSVEEIIQHPGFNDFLFNDIAILRLAQEVDLSLFSPVCIPPASVASSEEFAGQNATAVGWGALEYGTGDYPDTLQELQDLLPIVTRADCVDNQYVLEDDLLPGMFCAGGPGLGIDACQGDSGGPLTRQTSTGLYELVGAVSWGRNCAKSFGIYTDLPYYRQWVVDTVGTIYIA